MLLKLLIVETTVNSSVPAAYVRLLLNLYTNSVTCVSWNGVCSRRFPFKNGVRQGGIISPILFCVYIDVCCSDYTSLVSAVISGMSSLEYWLKRMMWSSSLLT